MGHIAVQTYRAVAGLGIRSCMLVCCSRSCPLTSTSQKLSNIVLFERCFLDIEQFQTHHFQQFLVTSNGVASKTFAFIDIEYGRPRRCLVSPTLETISPACHRFSTSGFFREMPNSHSFDEFSERLQIDLFTLGDPELNAVYSTTADV